jgi:hypothetical protein
MKTLFFTLAYLFFQTLALSQDGELHHDLESDSANHVSNIKEIFKKGRTEGHFRNHFMTTINQGDLKDYWANAIGGSLGYHTAEWKGFQVGVKGIFTFNLASSDLNELDPYTGQSAKWEKELFDITRPEEKRDLDRLEELYIKYRFKESYITFGKIDINKGPLLLKRDGRMKPFVYKGLWFKFNQIKNQHIYGGWINSVSPRGMTEWYSLNEAIGISNNGYLPNGEKADYHEQANTKGLGVLGYENELNKSLKISVWNYYLHKLYNTSWLQADFEGKKWYGGLQYVFQIGDPYQKTIDFEHRIYQPNERGNIVSTQFGYKLKDKTKRFSVGYLHGFNTGRFLFPKELTRENFYVSQPRSWVDGFGAVDIYMVRAQFISEKDKFKGFSADIRAERVQVPSASDYAQNKYGKSSYFQSTLIAKYSFQKKLSGLHFSALYTYRFSEKELGLSMAETFYKTNFHHLNFMLNIHF